MNSSEASSKRLVVEPVRAVILDFDGLIVDTETPIFESWLEAFREHGATFSLDEWQHALGTRGGFDPVAVLQERSHLPFDGEAVHADVRARNRVRCEAQPLLPGVRALLEDARKAGFGTAVASSSPASWVESWLEHHGIRPLFDVVCAADHVTEVKPAPDLFLLAAERLGVPPGRCLVFEDSPNGIRAARAAGMRCVAVPNALTSALHLPDPTLVVVSLAEVPLAAVLRRIGGN
jgi:HAD superfamily hydrolase (TIGR01509 family)